MLAGSVHLDPSDVASVKSQAKSYKLEDILGALRQMWGGERFGIKDLEKKKRQGVNRAYLATDASSTVIEEGSEWVWSNAVEEAAEDDRG